MKIQGKQQGFTLIELVIVIVILGILAATAAPKFIDLQSDAKSATMKAVKGALDTAIAGVHAKSLIAGNETQADTSSPSVTIAGSTVNLHLGWPLATVADIQAILDVDATNDFDLAQGTNEVVVSPHKATPLSATVAKAAKCYVSYPKATNSDVKPTITIDTSSC